LRQRTYAFFAIRLTKYREIFTKNSNFGQKRGNWLCKFGQLPNSRAMRKSPDLANKIMALHGYIKKVARLGLRLKTPTAGGGAVGVVEYD